MAARQSRETDSVGVLSRREVRQAVSAALKDLGLSRSQLARQARTGRFSSERARLVWSAIKDLAPSS